MPRLSLIAAMASNRVIGRENAMPWHLPEDAAHFRATTTGHAVLMGRKTWDSLPPRFRPLPGRRNVVLTRQAGWAAPGAEALPSLADALAQFGADERVFVMGGSEIYAQALPLADEVVLTELACAYEGDAHFPELGAEWQAVKRETHHAKPPNDFDFAFVTYRRG